jgi:hypothetical protein
MSKSKGGMDVGDILVIFSHHMCADVHTDNQNKHQQQNNILSLSLSKPSKHHRQNDSVQDDHSGTFLHKHAVKEAQKSVHALGGIKEPHNYCPEMHSVKFLSIKNVLSS